MKQIFILNSMRWSWIKIHIPRMYKTNKEIHGCVLLLSFPFYFCLCQFSKKKRKKHKKRSFKLDSVIHFLLNFVLYRVPEIKKIIQLCSSRKYLSIVEKILKLKNLSLLKNSV